MGYRKEKMKGTKFQVDRDEVRFTSSSNPDILQISGFFDFEWKGIHLGAYGSYGWFWDASIEARNLLSLVAPNTDLPLDYEGSGNVISTYALISYQIPLYRKSFFAAPLLGYGYDRFYQSRKNLHRVPQIVEVHSQEIALLTVTLDLEPLERDWWGPFIGGEILAFPLDHFFLQFRYSYHFLSFSQPEEFSEDISLRIQSLNHLLELAQEVTIEGDGEVSSQNAMGHRGFGAVGYQLTSRWKTSLFSFYQYYSTGKKRNLLDVTETITNLFPSFSVRKEEKKNPGEVIWQSFSIGVSGNFSF